MEPTPPSTDHPGVAGKSGGAFALVLALLLPAGLFAQLASPMAGFLWTELFVFLVPAVVATAGANLDPRAWLRLRPAPPVTLATAALVGLSGWYLATALFAGVRALAPAPLVARYDLARLFDGPAAAGFALAVTLVAPLCEEAVFRGHLASALHSRHRPPVAIGASAVLFALFHLDPLRGPSVALLGALYGWLAWRSGSIWPAVVAHAVNNGTSSALALVVGRGAEHAPEPSLSDALVGVAIGAVAVAAMVSVHRAASPAVAPSTGVPLADPADPSTRFRLSRVPRRLVWILAAGAASLGGILATVLRSRLLFFLLLSVPAWAVASPLLVIESRVGDGRWTRDPAVEARAAQPVSLRVAPLPGGAIRWFRIVPDRSTPYNNAVWPWDPGAYRWIGYAKIRYGRVEIEPFRGRWEIDLTPGAERWSGGPPPEAGAGAPAELGSHWFQAEVTLPGGTRSSAGLAQSEPRGLSPLVFRATFRDGDDTTGRLTGYFNVPGVFGSVPWQVRNYVGVDCADVLMAALSRARGEPIERDFNVATLARTLPRRASATLASGVLSLPLRWGVDVRRGDFVAVKYPGWGQFGHVGALYADANGDGILDAGDLVIHAGPSPLHVSPLGDGAFDGELLFLRPR